MIKKIPIKGITRDPSGQISSDGFCAESLNVQMDMGEVAPAIKPEPVKDAAGNDISVDGDILYIHKGIGYENLVYRDGRNLFYVSTVGSISSGIVFDGLGTDELINGITSVGNTLIVSTSKDMYYFLWKNGSYRFLGNKIPIPDIHFRIGNLESLREVPEIDQSSIVWPESIDDTFYKKGTVSEMKEVLPLLNNSSIGDKTTIGASSKKYSLSHVDRSGFWLDYLGYVWGLIDSELNNQGEMGKVVFPIFVRYAVRLYDGSIYSQSIPILLGADVSKFLDIKGLASQSYENGSPAQTVIYPEVSLTSPYNIFMESVNNNVFEGWEDIVTGVELFISPQMLPPERDCARIELVCTIPYNSGGSGHGAASFSVDMTLDPYYTETNNEKWVLNYQTTYLVKHFDLDEFIRLSGEVLLDDINFSSDYIMAQEALKETSQSMHHTVGSRLFNYNKRLLMADVKQSLYHGYPFMHSVMWNDVARSPIRILYNIRTENGETYVICRDENGNKQITPRGADVLENVPIQYYEVPVAWLAYPDSRCYRADVYFILPNGHASFVSYKMNAMDQIDVAYAFVGFGERLDATGVAVLPTEEKGTVEMPNSLVVSKVNNPFVFPAEDVITFTAGVVLNMAVASVPLSEGQAGQFPLYVFTDEGVFAMTVDAEGKLRTSHNVSRDILLTPDAVVGIEQGVFFAAARGLLLLQGSRVTKVSSEMEGAPDLLSEELLGRINNQLLGFSPDNPKELRSFLSGCFLAYDYANTRILVANPAYSAMYVYKFDTQSWHRLQTPYGKPVRALNSFPEAQLAMQSGSRQSLLDFSVLAESPDAETLRGLVYTRDLDLDGADIYKTISRLKVRGRFHDGHVKWQLQGSNDGLDYKTIHSLRGPSWKWYRLVLVTMLDKNERISYIELDYVPRFTDKIR